MNYEASRKILKAFEDEGVRYLVFGGVAVNLHGLPRFTEDLDVFIELSYLGGIKRAAFEPDAQRAACGASM